MDYKAVIYQLFPRLFGNTCQKSIPGGSIEQNGCGKFNDISSKAISSLREFGITHIWLTGIIRHATGTDYSEHGLPASQPGILKGQAGSPYAISDYYDVDPDLAVNIMERMDEFRDLVDRIHGCGLKVIIDFVPNHVSRDYKSLNKPTHLSDLGENDNPGVAFHPDNNYYYLPGKDLILNDYHESPARATGNDVFRPDPSPNDWYETVKLNYGVDYFNGRTYFDPIPDTWKKMSDILFFWANRGIDGFRCDMAGMVPAAFWAFAISRIKTEFPQILFIAELYEPSRYRDFLDMSGFDFLYDKVGWYDTVRSVIKGDENTTRISGIWQSLDGLDDRMLRFIENHDEQRIASANFAGDPWKGLPAMALAVMMNRGPVLIYNGQETGEPADPGAGCLCWDGRTSIFEYTSIPKVHKWFNHGACDGGGLDRNDFKLRNEYRMLLNLIPEWPVFSQGSFYDLMWHNENIPGRNRIYAFLRFFPEGYHETDHYGRGSTLLSVVCFDPYISSTRIRIPAHAFDAMGISTRERFTVRKIHPSDNQLDSFLMSQLTSAGINVNLGREGWAVLSIE